MFSFKYKFFALIVFTVLCFGFKTDKPSGFLLWQNNRLLTWDDFKGKPEKRFAAASTSYDILKEITKNTNGTTVNIRAVFFYYSSWKKKEWVNESVLAHEQKHFDIVELYARKLRKIIKETIYTSATDLENKIDALYDINDKAMDVYQDLYDDESDGSMNGDKQREWNKKIAEELKALDNYKAIEINLK